MYIISYSDIQFIRTIYILCNYISYNYIYVYSTTYFYTRLSDKPKTSPN